MLIGRRALAKRRSKQAAPAPAAGQAAEQKVTEQPLEATAHDEGRKGQRPQRRS